MMGDRIHWVFPPFLVAGLVIHLFSPLRLVPEWWMGVVIGVPLLVAAAIVAFACDGCEPYRWSLAMVLGYIGVAAIADSLWPIALLLPALIVAVKWRAIAVQTGHRPPGD